MENEAKMSQVPFRAGVCSVVTRRWSRQQDSAVNHITRQLVSDIYSSGHVLFELLSVPLSTLSVFFLHRSIFLAHPMLSETLVFSHIVTVEL